jgi:phosphatidylglycerophosphate synthase
VVVAGTQPWGCCCVVGCASHCGSLQAVKVNSLGKWKTACQMGSMTLLLFCRCPSTLTATFGHLFADGGKLPAWAASKQCQVQKPVFCTARAAENLDTNFLVMPSMHANMHFSQFAFSTADIDLLTAGQEALAHTVTASFAMLWFATVLALWSLAIYMSNVWNHFIYPHVPHDKGS